MTRSMRCCATSLTATRSKRTLSSRLHDTARATTDTASTILRMVRRYPKSLVPRHSPGRFALDSAAPRDQVAIAAMYNEDYLLRMFEQMAEMAAHLCGFRELVHIVQLNRQGDHARALAEID